MHRPGVPRVEQQERILTREFPALRPRSRPFTGIVTAQGKAFFHQCSQLAFVT